MVFSSLLFVFVFLVLNLVVYFLVDKKYKNQVLLIFSLIFYAWGGPRFLILLVGETFISWFCGIRIQEGGEPEDTEDVYDPGMCSHAWTSGDF